MNTPALPRLHILVQILFVAAGTGLAGAAEPAATLPAVLPQPVSLTAGTGAFTLTTDTVIISHKEFWGPANYLAARLGAAAGRPAALVGPGFTPAPSPAIQLDVCAPVDATLGTEGYQLTVAADGIRIRANNRPGAFNAIQTLLQLIPPSRGDDAPTASRAIPAVAISDHPRFPWRGLMLDVSRNFFPPGFIKRQLDEMAAVKLNVLHWHLTDDQGWRFHVPARERLTAVGAWRTPTPGPETLPGTTRTPDATAGGFYSDDEIRDLVAYAAQRQITILPEIDVPGHSYAATAAYPALSCTGRPERVLCAGNEEVFVFLESVLARVVDLFPGDFVHVGGDEVDPKLWQACPKCRARMQQENLATPEQLQGYFMRRVAAILAAHRKKLVGWDEILDGGAPARATVMSWRSELGGIEAARRGHAVIMTPMWPCYLDFAQGDRAAEPKSIGHGKFVFLREAFAFEPVPAGVDPKLILGGQGNLWTEHIATPGHAEYMLWPRAAALAERLWSPAGTGDWQDFTRRLESLMAHWDVRGLDYARSAFLPVARLEDTADGPRVALATEIAGTDLHYSFTSPAVDNRAPRYANPLTPPATADWTLHVAAYRRGQPLGKILSVSRAELALRREQLQAEMDWQRADRARVARKYEAERSARP